MRKAYFLSISCAKPVTETIDRCDNGKELMPWFYPGHACIGLRRCTVLAEWWHLCASCSMLGQPGCVWFAMVGAGDKNYKISSNTDLSIGYTRKIGFSKIIYQVFQKKPERVGTLVWRLNIWEVYIEWFIGDLLSGNNRTSWLKKS